jgi:hypothetical protein
MQSPQVTLGRRHCKIPSPLPCHVFLAGSAVHTYMSIRTVFVSNVQRSSAAKVMNRAASGTYIQRAPQNATPTGPFSHSLIRDIAAQCGAVHVLHQAATWPRIRSLIPPGRQLRALLRCCRSMTQAARSKVRCRESGPVSCAVEGLGRDMPGAVRLGLHGGVSSYTPSHHTASQELLDGGNALRH